MSPLRRIKIRIGELLLEKGLITHEQLNEAVASQQGAEKDKQLGQICIEKGFVDKEKLWFMLAVQSGYPYINAQNCVINREVLSLLNRAFVEKYLVLPIDKVKDIVTVAMANPLDKAVVDEIEKVLKGKVMIFLATVPELTEAIKQAYGKEKEKDKI